MVMIDTAVDFFKDHALNISIILALTYFGRKFLMIFVQRFIRKAIRSESFKTKKDEQQREDTLISTVSSAVRVVLWVLAGLLLLAEIGVNIAPLIAGAGIAGVALGFGAQSLVKDFISGIFILLENQYRVGDVVQINRDVSGTVERVTLRVTILRDLDGMVHNIPNGEVVIATNMTMDFANVNLDIGVGYDTDIEKLEKVVNKVGEDMAADEEWAEKIIEAPKFVRINEFADSSIVVKIVGKTAPIMQWSVAGELRKRLKIAFDKNNIDIPFPQRVIHESKK